MQFKIQVVVDDKHGETITQELITLDKSSEGEGLVGPSLSESKRVLKQLQKTIVGQQADRYTQVHRCCPSCHKKQRIKDSYDIQFQTFGSSIASAKSGRQRRTVC